MWLIEIYNPLNKAVVETSASVRHVRIILREIQQSAKYMTASHIRKSLEGANFGQLQPLFDHAFTAEEKKRLRSKGEPTTVVSS